MQIDEVKSKRVGMATEIAVMVPILDGKIPGEHRTYEQRLRTVISLLQARAESGIPTLLDRVSTIHFGRMIILRPEQLIAQIAMYPPDALRSAPMLAAPDRMFDDFVQVEGDGGGEADGAGKMIKTGAQRPPETRELPSWLLVLVSFDGDIRVYFREIAEFVAKDFDYIFRNCLDFPGTSDFEAFWAWIRSYQINVDLFYPRYPDLSLVRIKQLEAFKRRFDRFVAEVRSPQGKRVENMDALFDRFLRENQQYASGFPAPGGLFDSDHDGGEQ